MKVKATTIEVIDERTKKVLIDGVEQIIRVCRTCNNPRFIEHFRKHKDCRLDRTYICKPCNNKQKNKHR